MKKIIIFALLVCCSHIIEAQQFSQQVSVQANFGINSGIQYQYEGFNSDNGFSFDVGVNFGLYITNNFAVESGLHYGRYTSSFNIPKVITEKSNEIDFRGSAFQLKNTIKGYKEENKLSTFMIPLMFVYEIPFHSNRDNKFYVSSGVKYIMVLGQERTTQIGELAVEGYYPDRNLLVDDLPSAGFGKVNDFKAKDSTKQIEGSLAFALETGVSLFLGGKRMYSGVYFNYGISNFNKNETAVAETIVKYNPKEITKKTNGIMILKEVNKINFISMGVSLKYVIF